MRIAVMSDSHGDETNLRWLLEQLWKKTGKIDGYLHMGDGVNDLWRLEQFIRRRDPGCAMCAVKGNNDYGTDDPEMRVVCYGNVQFFMTHGHRYHVKESYMYLDYAARERGCKVALFGHTHCPAMEQGEILLLNPGSTRNDRIALIDIDEKGEVHPQLLSFAY